VKEVVRGRKTPAVGFCVGPLGAVKVGFGRDGRDLGCDG
jgi:hypothetical protein